MAEVLIYSPPRHLPWAADFCESPNVRLNKKYRFVVVPTAEGRVNEIIAAIAKIKSQMPDAKIVICGPNLSLESTAALNNACCGCHFIQTIDDFDFADTETGVAGPSRGQNRQQHEDKLVQYQHAALAAVHTAESITEIERQLQTILSDVLDLAWIKIFFYVNEGLDDQLSRIHHQALFTESLIMGSRHLGRIVFARNSADIFNEVEQQTLKQVSESVTMALDRLAKLEQAEVLKQQWESTFDAISEPLCLTDEKFQILRTNRAFLKTVQLRTPEVLGVNCFAAFCGSAKHPTALAPSATALIIQRNAKEPKGETRQYEVKTQRIQVNSNTPSILLILFRDVTEQMKIEKQIFESAKMAELGTIGSSIAHDINNPLGGMISFLQLIKMDLPKTDAMYEDILAMEAAGKQCKEIVENLLSFSRRQEASAAEPIDLREVLQQAAKINELQTRSLGIEFDISLPEKEVRIMGHFNLLSQALSNIFQNAFEAVAEKLNSIPGEKGQIKVELSASDQLTTLVIFDNGVGISPEHQNKIFNPLFSTKRKNENPGLGLTLAYQIIQDHRGQLEIFSQPKIGTSVKISFINV